MRTHFFLLVPLAMAAAAFAQDPSQGQFFAPPAWSPQSAPLAPVWKPLPLVNFTLPLSKAPVTLPFTPSPSAAAGVTRCAVPLIEMKTPAATDAIAKSPVETGDRIAIAPPVPACPAPFITTAH